MPNPGGRRGQGAAPPAWTKPAPPPAPVAPATDLGLGSTHADAPGVDLNPLVDAAGRLLAWVADIHQTPTEADLMALRPEIEQEARALCKGTSRTRADPQTLKEASYCLCTAIDESLLNKDWGREGSQWRQRSLLAAIHGDAEGGEKFFEILRQRMADPTPNIDLLELLYVCLALGFKGRYNIHDNPRSSLEEVRRNLYEVIRNRRGPLKPDLSPHWRSEAAARPTLEHPVPVWVIGAVAAVLLGIVFAAFQLFLAASSAPVMEQQLADLGPGPLPIAVPHGSSPAFATPDPGGRIANQEPLPAPLDAQLRTALQQEIEQQRVEVLETSTHVIVRINDGNGLFAPGSDVLLPQYRPLIERIRTALVTLLGDRDEDITIVGHTDNLPFKRRLRFQDNYDLSRARAESVARLLQEGRGLTRAIRLDGKGPLEPVGGGDPQAGNRTLEQRAANRRVEILIER